MGIHSLPVGDVLMHDDLLAKNSCLERLGTECPSACHGPLNTATQYWIATGKPESLGTVRRLLLEVHFRQDTYMIGPSTKPFGFGLYSSTGCVNPFGSWFEYLQIFQGSTLFPLPWTIWELMPDASSSILEITSASDWVRMVTTFPRVKGALIYPDWHRLSQKFDGVHLTLFAIAAIQGFTFPTTDKKRPRHRIAPAYWGVESTLWFKWCFDPRIVGEVHTSSDAQFDPSCGSSGA